MINVASVILCVGSGAHLWPLSLTKFPMQFLRVTGKEGLFQQAALRLTNLGDGDIKV
jgi:mannose-1-phosphate guanylyltransferase